MPGRVARLMTPTIHLASSSRESLTSVWPGSPTGWARKPRAGSRSDRLPIWHPSKPRGSSRRSDRKPTSTDWAASSTSSLTGNAPFRGDGQLDILRHVIADAPIPPRRVRKDTSVELEAIVLKCLEKNPARRYPSASELADDLNRFLTGQPTRSRPTGRLEQLARRAKRHPAALSLLAIVAAFVMTVLVDGRWYEARLQTDRGFPSGRNKETAGARHREPTPLQYVRDIRQADQLLRSFQAPLAMEVLQRQLPQAGEDDLREFTWYYLMRAMRHGQRTLSGDIEATSIPSNSRRAATCWPAPARTAWS